MDIVPDFSDDESISADDNTQRSGNGMRMVYEDELRKACDKRLLDDSQLRRWLEIRRKLPINRWIDRNRAIQAGSTELKELIAEMKDYLSLFNAEAKEMGLELDMNRNYYRAAVNLMDSLGQGNQLNEKHRKLLTSLMVMVDLKDARLAMQILASIA
jgi:hypothetical protein